MHIVPVGVVALAAIFLSSAFLSAYNLQILAQAFFYAVAAITVDLLWGYTGILSWGQSAFFGIGVYGIALALAHYGGGALTGIAGVAVAVVAAAIVAAGVGWLSFWDGAPSFFVAVVTLAIPVVFTQVILSGGTYTGSSSGLPFPAPNVAPQQWYQISGAFLVCAAVAALIFVRSDAGRVLVAIRENEERCRYLGLKTARWKIALMAICGALCALAGSLYAMFSSVAAPSYGDFIFGTELVIWTALGGRGTLIGPIVGAIFINYVSAVLGGNLPFLWLLIVGLIFIFVVIYLPRGFVPPLVAGISGALGTMSGIRLRPRAPGSRTRREPAVVAADGGSAELSHEVAMGAALAGAHAAEGEPVLSLRGVSKSYGSL
ncbi:MAG: branched-chain amino acid ABC transporter permease, partial [bacterium]|nr:branched-chain amino acid ABC transporter permease [bacterium]